MSLTTYCLLVAAGGQPGSRRQELTEKNKTLSFKSRILWDRILVTRHSGFRERKNEAQNSDQETFQTQSCGTQQEIETGHEAQTGGD